MFVTNCNNNVKKNIRKPNILRRKSNLKNSLTTLKTSDFSANKHFIVNSSIETGIDESNLINILGQNNLREDTDDYSNVVTIHSTEKNRTLQNSVKLTTKNIVTDIQGVHSTSLNYQSIGKVDQKEKSTLGLSVKNDNFECQSVDFSHHVENDIEEEEVSLNIVEEPSLDASSLCLPLIFEDDPDIEDDNCLDTSQQILSAEKLNCNSYFKCNILDCNKKFRNEERLNQHQKIHSKPNSQPRQTCVTCPVKKNESAGTEEPCGKFFHSRNQLQKHLKEEHTLDDANYSCSACGRKFFWPSGERTHRRAQCGRVLVCEWDGCGRTFRQPCRLREHARAHTGDKPYPCTFPECGWAFRTASKLVRHARRHTGERRHVCADCGAAFLRREHLRDHMARPHLHTRTPRDRVANGNASGFFPNSGKKKNNSEERESSTEAISISAPVNPEINKYFVKVSRCVSPQRRAESAERGGGAARTHCTWPLRAAGPHSAQVDQLYGLESNMYTIRSDLFLHGNTLDDEDSANMPEVVQTVGPENEVGPVFLSQPTLDTDLSLSYNADLMQEELLYTDDVAVDESSFQVLVHTLETNVDNVGSNMTLTEH